MNKCNRCNVKIKDNTNICPLCQELVSQEGKSEKNPSMYPLIPFDSDKFQMIRKITLFILFVTAIVLFIINYVTYDKCSVLWSLISVAAIFYGVVTINYSIAANINLPDKILIETIGAGILCVIIDNVLGYTGWSVNFMVPALILIADIIVIFLMVISPMKRKDYFMYQITITVFSIISFILCFTPVIARMEFPIITGLVCVVTLAGSIIFGDKSFKNELRRRFHV